MPYTGAYRELFWNGEERIQIFSKVIFMAVVILSKRCA